MPRSPAHDVAVWLNDQGGVGQFPYVSGDWSISVGTEPAQPEQAITLYDTGGGVDQPDAQFYDPTMQIRVRAKGYPEGFDKATQIRDLLILPTAKIIDAFLYTGFWIFTDVAMIGKDDNDRCIFTFNLRLMREPLNS